MTVLYGGPSHEHPTTFETLCRDLCSAHLPFRVDSSEDDLRPVDVPAVEVGRAVLEVAVVQASRVDAGLLVLQGATH